MLPTSSNSISSIGGWRDIMGNINDKAVEALGPYYPIAQATAFALLIMSIVPLLVRRASRRSAVPASLSRNAK
jgi:hypothetical protein